MTAILKVWIEEGCITCDACEETCPDVFSVTEDSCFIKPEVRQDGAFDENLDSQSHLKVEIGTSLALDIIDAAEGCPVEVIKFTEVGAEPVDAGGEEEVESPEGVAEPEPVTAAPSEPVADMPEEEPEEELAPLEPSGEMGAVKVWIEDGCITCDACEEINPEVFEVQDDTSIVRPAVMFPDFTDLIRDAAEECPVDVIKFEIGDTGLFRPTKAPKEAASEDGESEVQVLGALQSFTVPNLELESVNATLILHRYDPEEREIGTDEIDIERPGSDTLHDVLSEVRMNIDSSLGLHPSDASGHDGRCVVRVNGRLVVADRIRLADLTTRSNRLDIRAPRGLSIIRDLMVDPQPIRSSMAAVRPWMRNRDQAGRRTASGAITGLADPLNATEVHTITCQPSPVLAHCASDTVPHSPKMTSPPVLQRLWGRMKDDRTSKEGDKHLDKILSNKVKGGFAETDLSTFARHGFPARQTAAGILAARRNTLSRHRFSGRSGRHVKWFTKTVKSSGLLNETILAVQTLGPLGMIGNLGVTIRMATGFSRNGAPAVRDLQGFLAPGKMPKIINSKVNEHHQVVALFSELEKRL